LILSLVDVRALQRELEREDAASLSTLFINDPDLLNEKDEKVVLVLFPFLSSLIV
jgi:hypothetical protein